MRIKRRILKIKSKFYYYTLVFVGALSVMFLSRCDAPNEKSSITETKDTITQIESSDISASENAEKSTELELNVAAEKAVKDSIAEAQKKAQQQNIAKAKADSIAKAKIEKAISDSIENAKINQNPYKPSQPVTKYGVPQNKYK